MKNIVVLLFLVFAVISCKKKKTVWDTDWIAPIVNDTLSLGNLVNDSTISTQGGFYVLDLDRTLFDLDVTELIDIPDTTISEEFIPSFSFNLNPGFSFVNSVEEHVLALEDIQLKTILLKAGEIEIKLKNPLPTKTFFQVTLPGVEKDNVPFDNIYEAPPGTISNPGLVTEVLDLSGYIMDLTGVSGGDYNILKSQITASTDPNGPTVLLTTQHVTNVDATFRNIKIDYARGYFGNQILSDTSSIHINELNAVYAGAIDLPNSTFIFEIENGIKVAGQGKLHLVENTNSSGNVVALTGSQIGGTFNLDPATGSFSTLTSSFRNVEFNSSNSNIETYLENLGANHEVGYSIEINPWGSVSGSWDELFSNSRLRVKLKANMPLNIGMDNLTLKDTFDVVLNQDPDKTRIKSGELILNASNSFPISGKLKLYLLDEWDNVLHVIVGSNDIQGAQYGAYSDKHDLYVCNSEVRFVLAEEVLVNINDVRKIVVEPNFSTPNETTNINEPKSIPEGAFLSVKLKAEFKSENKF